VISVFAHHGSDRSEQAIGALRVMSEFAQDMIAAGILINPQQLAAPGQTGHLPASKTLTEATAVLTNHETKRTPPP